MLIQIDTREKPKAIKQILATFDQAGVKHISSKLYVGDYMSLDNPRVVIDRKQNLRELCRNVNQRGKKGADGTYHSEWGRFSAEQKKAADAGIKLIVLCEHGGNIKTLADVNNWANPNLKDHQYALTGEELYKRLLRLNKAYGTEFLFCTKAQTGKRIIELLEVEHGPTE